MSIIVKYFGCLCAHFYGNYYVHLCVYVVMGGYSCVFMCIYVYI